MRSSRAWANGMSAMALTISLVFGGAVTSGAQATTQGTATPTAKIIGKVTDTSGVPLPRAEVWLIAVSELRAVADDSGRFELAGLPSGPVTFGVRRLGFESATFSTVLKPGRTHRATFPLTPTAQSLAEVKVQDTASSWLAQFDAHRASHRGTFITRKDFEKQNLRIATDILRRVPGVQIVPTRLGTAILMTRGNGARRCAPQLYVHETPYSGNFDDFIPDDIEALEVYVGVSEIPPELINLGRPICAAIVIWTREPPPKGREQRVESARLQSLPSNLYATSISGFSIILPSV
ncbi:MAG TPA: carboxypeptidase regulatory-like domain-containing protein [Gemmatimonadaceae bacterium]|nr:carboxypeptidase regulatory-like domain-containing protein [Gemmatimonadaceae bacterium]